MNKLNQIIFTLFSLLCAGCSTTLSLPDRVSYASEKEILDKKLSSNALLVSGNPTNKLIFVSKSADSFCGGGHTSKFNVGEIFNLYLEQLSRVAAITCEENCNSAEITIDSADIGYSLNCMQGKIAESHFKSKLSYRITTKNGSTVSKTQDYANRVTLGDNSHSANEYFPITKSIENVVIQILNDISTLAKN